MGGAKKREDGDWEVREQEGGNVERFKPVCSGSYHIRAASRQVCLEGSVFQGSERAVLSCTAGTSDLVQYLTHVSKAAESPTEYIEIFFKCMLKLIVTTQPFAQKDVFFSSGPEKSIYVYFTTLMLNGRSSVCAALQTAILQIKAHITWEPW